MKKKLVVLVGVLCLAVLAGGCSKKNGVKEFGYDVSKYVTLGDYTGIKYAPEAVAVTDEEIQTRINQDLDKISTTEKVTDRAVKNGDTVNIDYKGMKDGVAFQGGTAKGQDLVIGSNTFIEGFESQLVGAKIGETKKINVTFPKNYQATELAGKKVVFEVKINSISVKKVPELTDDSANKISKDYKTVADYKAAIKAELEEQKKESATDTDRSNIWKQVVQNAKVKDYPEEEVKAAEKQYKDVYTNYAKQMNVKLADLLKQFGMSEADFNKTIKEYGKNSVGDKLVYQAISLKEDITLTDAEYKKLLPNYVTKFNAPSEKELISTYGEKTIKDYMLRDKVTDFVVGKAVVDKTAATPTSATPASTTK
jgi:trigger factor